MEDSLIITYDCCSSDVALCVARKEKDKIKVLNIIHGNEGSEIYNKLIGNNKAETSNDLSEVEFTMKPWGLAIIEPPFGCYELRLKL